MEQIIKEISELKTEVRYMAQTMNKIERVLENQAVLLEKISVANNRISDLEKKDEKIDIDIKSLENKFEPRIRKLEDWQIKILTIASIVWTIWAFILNKIF